EFHDRQRSAGGLASALHHASSGACNASQCKPAFCRNVPAKCDSGRTATARAESAMLCIGRRAEEGFGGMKSSNLWLVASCVVVAGASAAAVLALDHAGIISLTPSAEQPAEQVPVRLVETVPVAPARQTIPVEPAPEPEERLAYLQPETAVLPPPPAPEEKSEADELPSSEPAEPEVPDSWSAEVQPEE